MDAVCEDLGVFLGGQLHLGFVLLGRLLLLKGFLVRVFLLALILLLRFFVSGIGVGGFGFPVVELEFLPRMPFAWTGFFDGAFAWTGDFPCGRETRFGEALFLGEIIVFDEGLVVVSVEFGEEEVLYKADLAFDVVDCDGREDGRWGEQCGEAGDVGATGQGLSIYVCEF